MAVLQENEEETGGQPTTSTQQPATIQAGAPSKPAPTAAGAQKEQRGSGSFVNLQKYIQANKPKTQQLQQKITSGITSQAQKTRQELAQKRQQTESQYAQEEKRLQEAKPFYQQAFQKAGTGELSEQDVQRFRGLAEGKQAELATPELQRQRASAESLEKRARELGTSAGRQQELARTVGKQSPTYTAGQQSLDALLLSGDRKGRTQALRQVRGATQGLESQVGQLSQQAQARREALRGMARQRSQEIQQLLQQGQGEGIEEQVGQRGLSDIEQALQARREEAAARAPEELAAFRERVKSGALTQEDLNRFGLKGGQQLYDINLGDFIAGAAQVPTLAGVASPEEVRRYQALQRLAGGQGGILPGEETLTQAGTYDPGLARREELASALQRRRQEFKEFGAGASDEIAALQRQLGIEPGKAERRQTDITKLIPEFGQTLEQRNFAASKERARIQAQRDALADPDLMNKLAGRTLGGQQDIDDAKEQLRSRGLSEEEIARLSDHVIKRRGLNLGNLLTRELGYAERDYNTATQKARQQYQDLMKRYQRFQPERTARVSTEGGGYFGVGE